MEGPRGLVEDLGGEVADGGLLGEADARDLLPAGEAAVEGLVGDEVGGCGGEAGAEEVLDPVGLADLDFEEVAGGRGILEEAGGGEGAEA